MSVSKYAPQFVACHCVKQRLLCASQAQSQAPACDAKAHRVVMKRLGGGGSLGPASFFCVGHPGQCLGCCLDFPVYPEAMKSVQRRCIAWCLKGCLVFEWMLEVMKFQVNCLGCSLDFPVGADSIIFVIQHVCL